ncbi:MAG: hypothetical protein ACYC6Y_03150 [Thermoguttaceae bacterium]
MSTRPGTGASTRPGTGVATRPSPGDLQGFLDLGSSAGAGRPSTLPANRPGNLTGAVAGGVAAGAAGGAAAEFLRDSGARPGTLPATRPGDGIGQRPGDGIADRPGVGERPGLADRPLADQRPADRPIASNRPDRIENRQEWQQNRVDRRGEIYDHMHDHPVRDFWSDHPLWGAWAITRPFRWATWGNVTGWVGYGWTDPYAYSYGEEVYYSDNSVYYGDQVVATSEEYAQQAEQIAAAAPETPPADAEWMPLGVFALTPDGQATGPDPTLFLQLAISKEGIISGTFFNSTTNETQAIEGMADKATQRVAWNAVGKTRPIMETGIMNLTENSAPALVHFADGQTQQWLMVRLEDPAAQTP